MELNEKIAKFSGLSVVDHKGRRKVLFERIIHDEETGDWGSKVWIDVPNFTESLDALFKYAVPKLEEDYTYALYKYMDEWVCEIHEGGHILSVADSFEDGAKTPAMAMSLAIEKLIKEQEDE